jgi:hypothetical protein
MGPGGIFPHTEFSEGIAAVSISTGGWEEITFAYIDTSGKKLFETDCQGGEEFNDGLAPVIFSSGEYAIIDRSGGYVVGPDPRMFNEFSEGMASFLERFLNGDNSDYKYGYINKCGVEVMKPIYDDVRSFHEGLAAVAVGSFGPVGGPIDQLWGYIDAEGNMVIKTQFSLAWDFADGLAPVYVGGIQSYGAVYKPVGGKWGYIDHSGNFVIPAQFELARQFDSGLAKVLFEYADTDSHWGYIDTKGKVVWEGNGDFFNGCYWSAWGPAGWM